MATPTFYPTTLTDEALAESLKVETQRSFDKIVADMKTPPAESVQGRAKPKRHFVTVRVTMPHVQRYGKPATMQLTYGCTFDVTVGDTVLCPPTRLNQKWTRGVVVDLDSNGYRGPVKYLAALGGKKNGGSR